MVFFDFNIFIKFNDLFSFSICKPIIGDKESFFPFGNIIGRDSNFFLFLQFISEKK